MRKNDFCLSLFGYVGIHSLRTYTNSRQKIIYLQPIFFIFAFYSKLAILVSTLPIWYTYCSWRNLLLAQRWAGIDYTGTHSWRWEIFLPWGSSTPPAPPWWWDTWVTTLLHSSYSRWFQFQHGWFRGILEDGCDFRDGSQQKQGLFIIFDWEY